MKVEKLKKEEKLMGESTEKPVEIKLTKKVRQGILRALDEEDERDRSALRVSTGKKIFVKEVIQKNAEGVDEKVSIFRDETHRDRSGVVYEKMKERRTACLVMFAMAKNGAPATKTDATKKEVVEAKELSSKQIEAIKKDAIKLFRSFDFTVPPEYTIIIPVMKLAEMNRGALVNFVQDVLPRVDSVPDFSVCIPSLGTVQDILDELLPLAIMKMRNMTPEQKANVKTLERQLRLNFTALVKSCATLANGNWPLFSILNVPNKRKAEKTTVKLSSVSFKLSGKFGVGKIKATAIVVDPLALRYIIYYGVGAYDPATWKYKIGSSNILVTDLTPGVYYSFIMVAVGILGEGDWANPQSMHAPQNS